MLVEIVIRQRLRFSRTDVSGCLRSLGLSRVNDNLSTETEPKFSQSLTSAISAPILPTQPLEITTNFQGSCECSEWADCDLMISSDMKL